MKRFFSGRKQPPAENRNARVPRREDFEKKVASMLKATESNVIEARVIPYRCAVTGRKFSVRFERPEGGGRFCVARIDKETGGLAPGHGTAEGEAETFDGDDFDLSGRACPWCGNKGVFVHCHECCETVCGGRTKIIAGEEVFTCHDACGATGAVTPYDKMHGADAAADRKALGRSEARRLGGKSTRVEGKTQPLLGKGDE